MVSAGTTARRRLRRTVVCLDDDPQVLSSLRRLLREEPVELLTTDQPETALDWVDHKKVDLLITDLRMPGMDGAEILKVVEERSPSTKSLVLTGYPEASPPSQPMISKPWDDAELKQRIRELTRPLPYVVLMPPEPRVRLALVGVERAIADLAPGWFEIDGTEPAELALIDAQRAGVDAARALPGAYKVLLTDDASGARLREWYDAGVDQILRKPVSDAAVADVLRRAVPLARLRQRLAREESDRLAASWPRRLLHRIWKLGAAIPGRSTILILTAALTLGILFAISLNTISVSLAAEARGDPFADRFLRFSAQEMMLRRWTTQQQVEMGREMNETTRRYYEEQLRNQRWQGFGPRREPAEAPPPPRTVVVPVEVPSSAPASPPSGGRYGTGAYPGNGLPYQ
jgi:DNA-binding NarL/FixJ family response regulator